MSDVQEAKIVSELDDEPVEVESEEVESVNENELSQQIDKLTQEKNDIFQRLLVSEADMKNLRRRTEIDLSNAHKYGLEKFAKELLPCVDAVEAEILELNKKENLSEELVKFKEGSELTYRMLMNALEKFGIKQIHSVGEILNPDLQQAIAVVPMADKASNEIIEVTQKGYTLNDRLLRAALVVVAQ